MPFQPGGISPGQDEGCREQHGARTLVCPFFGGFYLCPGLWGKDQEQLLVETPLLIPADAPNQDVINSEPLFPECCLHKRELI